jgi:serine/threonine protein kinase
MELCAGGTLRGLLDRTQWIPLGNIRVLMHGFLDGLEFVHANQLIHLDLKPDNLFLSDDGGLKIGDFGLCRKASDWDAEEGDGAYMAPEVLNNQPTVACDIFSAGLILYQLLNSIARLPSHGLEWQRLRSGHQLLLEVPAGRVGDGEELVWWASLASLCSAMLAPSSDFRPSAQQCLSAPCFAGLGSQAAVPAE